MKKLIFGALALLLTSNLFACHMISQGNCGDDSYFETYLFNNNSVFEFRYLGADTVCFTYTTKSVGNTDTTISFPGGHDTLQFRFKAIGGQFNAWGNNGATPDYFFSSSKQLAGCSTLAVTFTNFTATKVNGALQINFRNEDETDVSNYYILLSKDGTNFTKTIPIANTGSNSYSITLGANVLAFLFPFLISYKKRKINPLLALFIILSVIFLSCQKDKIFNTSNYHYAKIEAVKKSGGVLYSNILKF